MTNAGTGGLFVAVGTLVLAFGVALKWYRAPDLGKQHRWWRLLLSVVLLALGDLVVAWPWFGSGLILLGVGVAVGGPLGSAVGLLGMFVVLCGVGYLLWGVRRRRRGRLVRAIRELKDRQSSD